MSSELDRLDEVEAENCRLRDSRKSLIESTKGKVARLRKIDEEKSEALEGYITANRMFASSNKALRLELDDERLDHSMVVSGVESEHQAEIRELSEKLRDVRMQNEAEDEARRHQQALSEELEEEKRVADSI